MNTPNKLTVLRIIMVVPFMWAIMMYPEGGSPMITAALVLFILASVTDAVDGHMARKYNLITDFGKFMDPLADKILTTAAFLGLMSVGRASGVAIMLILTREFVVSGIRLVAASSGTVIAASVWGKVKTVFQMLAIIVSIILLYFPYEITSLITQALVWLSAIITVISGIDYVVKNISVIKEAK